MHANRSFPITAFSIQGSCSSADMLRNRSSKASVSLLTLQNVRYQINVPYFSRHVSRTNVYIFGDTRHQWWTKSTLLNGLEVKPFTRRIDKMSNQVKEGPKPSCSWTAAKYRWVTLINALDWYKHAAYHLFQKSFRPSIRNSICDLHCGKFICLGRCKLAPPRQRGIEQKLNPWHKKVTVNI